MNKFSERLKQKHGFTLVEILMIVTVLSILAIVSYPTFKTQRERGRLKRAGRDIVSHMQLAKISAMRNGEAWAIQFDTSASAPGYRLLGGRGDDGVWDTADDPEEAAVLLSDYGDISFGSGHGQRPGATGSVGDGVVYGTANRLVFNSNGTSQSGTVYIKNKKGDTFAVGTIATTGRIKTWANYGAGWEE